MAENAKVEPTQGDAPSKYYKICGVPVHTPALISDAYGFQWLHFGADLQGEVKITEQLKAAYTQIGTMAAVMIIFSTNMLLARTKLDVRSDIEARRQIMNFYTLAWIVADVAFVSCALCCWAQASQRRGCAPNWPQTRSAAASHWPPEGAGGGAGRRHDGI